MFRGNAVWERESYPDSDRQLMSRVSQGDRQTFAEIYRKFYSGTRRYFSSLGGHRRSLDDLVQEVFTRAWQHRQQFQGHTNVQARLLGIARNVFLEELAQEAAAENAPYEHYLLQPTELEVAARTANAIKARIKQASFPAHKDFDTYDFSIIPSLNKQEVLQLARGEWIDKHDNCCLIGNPGTGKTHLAIALGLAACRQGRRVSADLVFRFGLRVMVG